jgi:hypothetical protein
MTETGSRADHARRGAKCSEMAFALGARAISAVESEAVKAVGASVLLGVEHFG